MKTRLLKRLRKEAKEFVKIIPYSDGFGIENIKNNTNYTYSFYNPKEDVFSDKLGYHYPTIYLAKKALYDARRVYIMEKLPDLRERRNYVRNVKLAEGL